MERSNQAARNREAELTDRILAMKGYREFAPAPKPIEVALSDWQETSVLEEDGFEPF